MSIQQSSHKLFQHGFRLVTVGNWRFNVVNRRGELVRANLTPEDVTAFTLDVRLKANMNRMIDRLSPAPTAQPVITRRVWRIATA